MDAISADNPGNCELTNAFPTEIDFLQPGDNSNTSHMDPQSILEMRISELWKKLEETTNNLNSCDSMLETYCKTVAEKLNQKRCPNCLNVPSMNETINSRSNKIKDSIPWNPKTLIEGISSSLQKIESTIINDTDLNLSHELDLVEETVTQHKVSTNNRFPIGDFCEILQEVLFKMKTLEASLHESSKSEHLNVCEENISVNKTIADQGDRIVTSQIFGNTDKQHVLEMGTFPFNLKDESEVSHLIMSCIIVSLAVSALATEVKENEKHQKRGIIGLGYGSGLGSYGYSGLGLGNAGILYSGLGHSGLGISGLGYSSLGLSGIGYGRSYGYAAAAPLTVAAAPLTVAAAPLALATAPIARTVVASAPFVSRVAFPVHAPVAAASIATHVATPIRAHVATPITVAAPITAHVTTGPVQAHIAAPIAAHAPVAAFTAHVAAPVTTHHVAAPVHIASPITARIAAPIAAPITAVNFGYGGARLGHGRPLLH